jgi:phosphatidylglycerol:prolipoprotein diacylglycerol transferase
MRRQNMPLLGTSDAFAPGLALGHAIGKVGCFAAGCCWGIETKVPWAVKFHDPAAYALTGVPLEIALHPAQLYESGSEALVFGFLYWRFGRQHAPGQIIGLYLVLSSVLRFFIEFTRNHEQALPFGMPLSITQWIAIGLAAAGAVLLVRARRPAAVRQPVHA